MVDHDSRGGPVPAALIALALAGCGDAPMPTGATEAQIGDSAGVRIVEYSGTPSVPSLTLAEDPLYTHGAGPDDYQFASISGGALYPDGGAAVFDWQNREIVVLGPDGAVRNLLARQGEGPGEISGFGAVGLIAGGADTLLVEDEWHMRLTLFAGDAVAWTARLPAGGGGIGLRALGLDGGDGVLMASTQTAAQPAGGIQFDQPWLSGHMVRFDVPAEAADTVADYDWLPIAVRESTGLLSHSGRVGVVGDEFVHGRNDTPELVWRRPDGTVRQIMRWRAERVLTTEERWEPFVACMLHRLREMLGPGATEERFRENVARWDLDPAAPEPLFRYMHGDDEGRLWLENAAIPPCHPVRYTVIGPDGTRLGVFEPPEWFRLLHVAGGRALGVVTDELGVPSVAVYEVVGDGLQK